MQCYERRLGEVAGDVGSNVRWAQGDVRKDFCTAHGVAHEKQWHRRRDLRREYGANV